MLLSALTIDASLGQLADDSSFLASPWIRLLDDQEPSLRRRDRGDLLLPRIAPSGSLDQTPFPKAAINAVTQSTLLVMLLNVVFRLPGIRPGVLRLVTAKV